MWSVSVCHNFWCKRGPEFRPITTPRFLCDSETRNGLHKDPLTCYGCHTQNLFMLTRSNLWRRRPKVPFSFLSLFLCSLFPKSLNGYSRLKSLLPMLIFCADVLVRREYMALMNGRSWWMFRLRGHFLICDGFAYIEVGEWGVNNVILVNSLLLCCITV